MIEASPLIVRKLRHHAFHITGIRPYDYRSKGDTRRAHFEARLQALRELAGDSLLVPESPALGGFGYDIGGRLFNVDTLKFFEVLIGMERGGVLAALRDRERPVVCEIGAGWGGFAYQFKTLFPRSTYVIVDFPELFLFSATYLATVFPDARLAFVGAGESPARARRCRLRVRAAHARRPRHDRIAGSARQHGLVSGDDRRAGSPLRGDGGGGRLPARLQLQSRALAVQHRARQGQRRAGRAVSAHRSAGAQHGLHERDEEAAEGGEAGRALRVQLPASGRAPRSVVA